MTDLEISRALALAIGWEPYSIVDKGTRIVIITGYLQAQEFDYRDEVIAFRVAEKFDAFPYQTHSGTWTVGWTTGPAYAKPQKAIALAVIGAKK